jgi:hypothetical protein
VANYTIGTGQDYASIEAAASDPTANAAGNYWFLKDYITYMVSPSATIDAGVTIYGNGRIVDCTQVTSGTCITGGHWKNTIFRRYPNDNPDPLIADAVLENCTIYTPRGENDLSNCTGDKNAVLNLNGIEGGLTGTDNKLIAYESMTDAMRASNPGLFFDGVDDRVDLPIQILDDFTFRWSGRIDNVQDNSLPYIMRASSDFVSGVYIYFQNVDSVAKTAKFVANVGDGGALNGVFINGVPIDVPVEIYVNVVGRTISVEYHGITDTYTHDSDFVYNSNDATIMGRAVDNSSNTRGEVYSFSLDTAGQKVEYISTGDFGSTTLTDHSGNGNDGTIEGATWILTTDYKPKINGSLALSDGTYAGAISKTKTTQQRIYEMENSAKYAYAIDVSSGDWARDVQPAGAGNFARGHIVCNGTAGDVAFVMDGVTFTQPIAPGDPVMMTPETVLQSGTTATGLYFVA